MSSLRLSFALLLCIVPMFIVSGYIVPAEEGHLRKLIGSNCVLIERGNIPPYYDCVGCIVEEAAACIDDMRTNKSYNVAPTCKLNSVKNYYDHACCPKFFTNQYGVINLQYSGSAYPEALRCMKRQGCETSVMYKQLQEECLRTCPFKDERPRLRDQSSCYSDFNSATSLRIPALMTTLLVLLMGVYLQYV